MNCCYASNLYNKIKERLTGRIRFQKKYLHINKEGNVLEWSFEPDTMDLDYNQVSITRNIGLSNISFKQFEGIMN